MTTAWITSCRASLATKGGFAKTGGTDDVDCLLYRNCSTHWVFCFVALTKSLNESCEMSSIQKLFRLSLFLQNSRQPLAKVHRTFSPRHFSPIQELFRLTLFFLTSEQLATSCEAPSVRFSRVTREDDIVSDYLTSQPRSRMTE